MATANAGARVVFLPWVREGAIAALTLPDPLSGLPGTATLSAALSINGAELARQTLQLPGPAEPVGIDARQIVRCVPPPGSRDVEPNHFAAIEFDRPDFPWLFTPAGAGTGGRLRPWLCLVVVRLQPGVQMRPALDSPLPVLEIAAPAVVADELPELAEGDFWAHAQVAAAAGDSLETLRQTLAGPPERSLSRLLCPRLLESDTEYLAAVVPSFEAGRRSGLGLAAAPDAPLEPAWAAASALPLRLPVYHQWSFRTGAGGDFKSLALQLRPQPAPTGLGRRAIVIGRPGFDPGPATPPEATLELEGALKPIDAAFDAMSPWPDAATYRAELERIVDAPGRAALHDPATDPLLAPPLYGAWHAGRATVEPGAEPWLDELNLDPRHRIVAAFGTQVVQEHQEALMASAWEQAGELQRANQRLRQLQLALHAGTRLHARHVEHMEVDALLRVGAPALTRLRAVAVPGETRVSTLASGLDGAALSLKSLSPPMRKLARPRGPVGRRLKATRVADTAITAMTAFASRINVAATSAGAPAPSAMTTFNSLRAALSSPGSVRGYAQVTEAEVAGQAPSPRFQVQAEGQRVLVDVAEGPADSPAGAAFRAAARAHLTALNPGRPWLSIFVLPRQVDLAALRTQMRAQMAPARHVQALATAVVQRGADAGAADPQRPLDTVMFAPRFPQPMYAPLRDLSQDLLLPGLDRVLRNAVIGLRTNRRFVDAYLVGLNHEMARELLWRGYPTDLRGTCFDRFWDSGAAGTARADIAPLHTWGTRVLGGSDGPAQDRFVMLVRGELLRRYPGAVVYAVPAVASGGGRRPATGPDLEIAPAFRGALPPDVHFFGFDLTVAAMVGGPGVGPGHYIVLQEQPGEPNFGLDVGTAPANRSHLRVADGAPPGLPLRSLSWGLNAGHVAGILRRQPARIAIHASQFVQA